MGSPATASFVHKPDLAEAQKHWEAFWAGEIIDRPCIRVISPRDGVRRPPHPPGLHHPDDDLLGYVRSYDDWAAATYFGADAIPFFFPNPGPDIFSAFLGADLEFAKEAGTSWAKPFVTDWKRDIAKLERPGGAWWDRMLGFVSEAARIAEGRFAIGVLDLHSNLDCLTAVRGPQALCLDLLDRPDDVEAALRLVRANYAPIFDAFYKASRQDATGCLSWLPMYCEGRFAPIQCDFTCMISPQILRRFVLPALEEEAEYLDHCCYHYDGPDALVHLEDILSIKQIDAIQWVPGAGNAPHIEWMDLLKKIQAGGKSLYISATSDEVKIYHAELRPEKVFYDVSVSSESEANAMVDWLKANT